MARSPATLGDIASDRWAALVAWLRWHLVRR